MNTRYQNWLALSCAAALWAFPAFPSRAHQFQLGDVTVDLQEITSSVDVYFRAMRFNRAANEWNVDVTISNKSSQAFSGPLVLLVDSFSGTSGPLRPDGVSTNQPFYDFSGELTNGGLGAGIKSGFRTIGLGSLANASPQLTTRTFAAQVVGVTNALAFTRSLNEAGQPLPGVSVTESGPAGFTTNVTDGAFGVVTLGSTPGDYVWQFSQPGYLPVWRRSSLSAAQVAIVPYAWLTPRDPVVYSMTPLAGGVISNQSVVIQFPPGSFSQNTTARLTMLAPQTLPYPLPSGWSPLQAFWLELGSEPIQLSAASLVPWGAISLAEKAVLARLDPSTLAWTVFNLTPGNGSNTVSATLPGSGAYALVVADTGTAAPPTAVVGQPLLSAAGTPPNPANLAADGVVVPATSPASIVPSLVTATADVAITNLAAGLSSGTQLRGDVSQSYLLQDGTHLTPPFYDEYLIGYQRPGDPGAGNLHARFPLRPVLLLGPQELNQGLVHVDLFAPSTFAGGVLDTNGGLVAKQPVRLLAAPGTVQSLQAVELRLLNVSNFTDLAGTNFPVAAAFEVNLGGVVNGQELSVQITGLPTNSSFVLARVLMQAGIFGLEPRKRLQSDGNGNLASAELTTGDRLPGLTGAGDYLLLQVQPQQDLVEGVARNSSGQPTNSLPVRVAGQPWLTFSASDGSFKLLAPAGSGTLNVADLSTGDSGTQAISIPTNLTPVSASIASVASGLQVVSVTPSNGAVAVPLVSSVSFTFNRPVNPATLLSNAVQLLGASNQPVAATVSLNLANTTATLLPGASLDPATVFTVLLATNIADTIGRALTGTNQFTFTTVALSARDPAAQLIIYEPGATNVPTNVIAQIPGYVPGTNKNVVVVQGTPGAADPGVPVIIVNEASGETTTVLSKADGSFTSFVAGQQQDFISATFVSLNGARIYVPVNRQLFDDGSVGLYQQGGTLQAVGAGGQVQVTVPPHAIATRTKFTLDPVSVDQLQTQTGGVLPETGTVAGGALHIHIEGDAPTLPLQASFQVDLTALGYDVSNDPSGTNAALALAAVQYTQGVPTYQVLDQMIFHRQPQARLKQGTHPRDSNDLVGTIVTVIGFTTGWSGAIGQVLFDTVLAPLMLGSQPVIVQGIVSAGLSPLSGAFIILRPVSGGALAQPGRLIPGMVYATSGADGSYSMTAPAASDRYLLVATHPLYSDTLSASVYGVAGSLFSGVLEKNFLFLHTVAYATTPSVNIANSPVYPAPGQDCVVEANASRSLGGPPHIQVTIQSVTNFSSGSPASLSDIVFTNVNVTDTANAEQWVGTLHSFKPVNRAILQVVVGTNNFAYPIAFGGVPPPPVNNIVPISDPNDTNAPLVTFTAPLANGFVDPSGTVQVTFNKPIDLSVQTNLQGILLKGPNSDSIEPIVQLNSYQNVLTLQFPGMQPAQSYTLTLTGASIRSLNGVPLDQVPTTPQPDSFSMTFQTAPVGTRGLPSLANGRGSAISANRLYVLDQASQDNYLDIYDISSPSSPGLLSQTHLFGVPRDLAVMPQFRYVRNQTALVETNDLVAIVGGDLATIADTNLGTVSVPGQYLWVLNVSNSYAPQVLASPIVSYRVGSAVTKVRWSPPYLVYQEFGSDIQQIGFVNLQELLIGYGSSLAQEQAFPTGGTNGVDLNGDGDYVDPGETLPIPPAHPLEFYGKHQSYVLQHTKQEILDFAVTLGGATLGITLNSGEQLSQNNLPLGNILPPAYRTLSFNGFDLDVSNPTNAAFYFDSGAYPRWVTILDSLPVVSNGVPQILSAVALVSLTPDADNTQKVAVIDISLPTQPRLLNKISVPASLLGGSIEALRLNPDGLLELAGSQNVVLMDPGHLLATNTPAGQLNPAIVGFVPAAGTMLRSVGSTDYGVYAVAEGGRGVVVQTPPPMQFVCFPGNTSVFDPRFLPLDDQSLANLMRGMVTTPAIPPATLNTNFDIPSDLLNPPNPAAHFHVLVSAPGGSGTTIELGLEALNHAGWPLANQGGGFAPVRAISTGTQLAIGQTPRPNCGAPIRSLTAYRLSSNPHSPYYNRYLSRPFALIGERVSADQLAMLQTVADREILWSGAALRAFIDPGQSNNPGVGPFAAHIDTDRKVIFPISSAVARSVDKSYIMGVNPPPAGGSFTMPGTFGTVSAQNGELRTEATDMMLPSPRMPIEVAREIGTQDTFEGPFGVGWDFDYNQRLTELDPLSFPLGLQMPLIVRDTKADSEIAGSQDVLFHTGLGRIIHFRWISTNTPPEYASDPLVQQLNYQTLVSDYYLPEPGVFDLLVKLKDGTFERLTPGGTRYRYLPDGHLHRIYDRYDANYQEMTYDSHGWLTQIDDHSVTVARYVQLGHFRHQKTDSDFVRGLDIDSDNSFLEGKICCLSNYAGGTILYQYSPDGFLTNRLGMLVDGENGGFAGRSQIQYIYSGCQLVSIAATASGTPIFSAVNNTDSSGKNVVATGNGIDGPSQFNIPLGNTAANLSKLVTGVTLGDGSSTQFKFDKWGHPTSSTVSGPGGPSATTSNLFDQNGLLIFVQHPEGNTETLSYDTNNAIFRSRGNLLSIKVDPGPRGGTGCTETFNYNSMYNLKSGNQTTANGFTWTYALTTDKRAIAQITYGIAGTETFGYNAYGQLTSHTNIRGVAETFDYGPSDGFLGQNTLGGNQYVYHYGGGYASELGKPDSITPPEGAPIQFQYNGNLQKVQVQRDKLLEKSACDEEGHVVSVQKQLSDGRTLALQRLYDVKGFLMTNLIQGLEVNGQTLPLETDFTPDNRSRLKKIRFPQGTVQMFDYDGRGNITNMTLGDYKEQYAVDLNNNVTAVTEGGDVVKTTVFDGLDRPVTITRKTGTQDYIETKTYYEDGELKSDTVTDPLFGELQQWTFDQIDEVGRPLHETITGTSISPSFQYAYSPGSLTVTGPRMTTKSLWDNAGYDTEYTDPILDEVFHRNGYGTLTQVDRHEDGATYNNMFAYDNLESCTSSSDNLGSRFLFLTRTDGSLMAVTNANGNATVLDHSVIGELLSKQRADGMQFEYQYDSLRHGSYAGDPAAGFHYAYDQDFRLTNSTLRTGAATLYGSFDPRNMPQMATIPGGTVTMRYDLQRRLTDKTVTYQSTSYQLHQSYDALNRVRVLSYQQDAAPLNTISNTYDEAGPVLSTTVVEDGQGFGVGYGYYTDGARQSVTYPSGVTVTEVRDPDGRLTGVLDASGPIFRITSWQGNRQPKTINLGPWINILNQYDARGRLVAGLATNVSTGAVLSHMRYLYDGADNLLIRQFLQRGGKADNLFYDVGERLSRAQVGTIPLTGSGWSTPLVNRTYNYHASGLDYLTSTLSSNLSSTIPPFATNWTAHDDFLLPTIVDGVSQGTADPAGNVSQPQLWVRPAGANAPQPVSATLTHNGNGNLIHIVRADGVIEDNFFQPDGLRYERKVSQGATILDDRLFLYDDAGRLLEEYDRTGGSPSLIARYYYAATDAPDAADLRVPPNGTLQRFYYLKDNQQSVIAVADANGRVVERVWYDPYGQPFIEQRDATPPAVRRVIGGASGSLLVELSEPVLAPHNDPGPGVGIVRLSEVFTNALAISGTNGVVGGPVDLLPSQAGFAPYSVLLYSPTQALAGPLTITLNAGTVADEWGNTNAAQIVSINPTGTVGTVYYQATPDLQTGPTLLARSSVGSPFLFHGQYFDYDTGLIYLRARFYDPFSGMFLEPDPLGYEDSVNLYAGMGNNPASVRDPSGLGTPLQWFLEKFGSREVRSTVGTGAGEQIDRTLARDAVEGGVRRTLADMSISRVVTAEERARFLDSYYESMARNAQELADIRAQKETQRLLEQKVGSEAAAEAAAAETAPSVGTHPGEVPAATGKYNLLQKMGDKYWKKDIDYGTVNNYIRDDVARNKLKLELRDGRFYDAEGKLFDTAERDATGQVTGHKPAIYVMDKFGGIYAYKYPVFGEWHHSCFFAGGEVAAAGELRAIEGSIYKVEGLSEAAQPGVNRASGHYSPEEWHMQQFRDELTAKQIDVSRVKVTEW